MSNIVLYGPSYCSETGKEVDSTYRFFLNNPRSRHESETYEEYCEFLYATADLTLPRKAGETKEAHCNRAMTLLKQWWTIGETH
jgi:hypothetical protein